MPRASGGAGNARHWLKRARKAGATVRLNSKSETVVEAPGHRKVVMTARRKDTSRKLITLVRRLEKEKES